MRTRTAVGSGKSPLKMLWQRLQQGAVQQERHDFSVWLRCAVAAAICLFASMPLFATTYVYSSPNYTSVGGSGTPAYTTAMYITGSFTTASPLPANMPATDIGPSGSNLIQAWTFNDGLHTYTSSNSKPNFSGGQIVVSTDATGNIRLFGVSLVSPLPPHTVGQKLNYLGISFGPVSPSAAANSGVACTAVDGTGNCNASGAPDSFAYVQGGTFATSAATLNAAPNPAQPGQTVVLTANTGSSTATGTVTFSDAANVLCNAVVMVNGAASCSTSTLSVGSHTIIATFTITTASITVPPPFSVAALVTITATPPPSAAVPAPALGTLALALMALTMLLALALRRKNI